MRIQSNGTVYLNKYNGGTSSTKYYFGSDDGENCFDDDQTYKVRLYTDKISGSLKTTTSYGAAEYSGHYLNWYFSEGSFDDYRKSGTRTRIEMSQDAAVALVNDLENIRVGLAIYDNSDDSDGSGAGSGAKILVNVADIGEIGDSGTTATHRANIISEIKNIVAVGFTPLGESIMDLGRYYTIKSGDENLLKLHPDGAAEQKLVSTIFVNGPTYDGITPPTEVIENWCQDSFIVAMTDGLPSNNRDVNVSSYLNSYATEDSTDDYADDIVKGLYDMDLRPDLTNNNAVVKNNVTTYMVGFSDPQVINSELIKNMANFGVGNDLSSDSLLIASSEDELQEAFKSATNSIFAKVAAGSGAAFNTSQLSTDSTVYAASFNSAEWSGSLQAYELSDTGVISATASWDAATKLDAMAYNTRNVYSYNVDTNKGIEFKIDALSSIQKQDLQKSSIGSTNTDVTNLINYLKGDRSNEGSGSTEYRVRASALGDIASSTVVYVGAPQLNWPSYLSNDKFGTTTNDYATFKSGSASTRTPMLYVGANDGMLHGFNADKSDANVGQEKLAYIPAMVASTEDEKGLHYLAEHDYAHQFYVDLTPTVSDVYIDNAWRTVLVGGLRSGGKGIFALDITNPSQFSSSTANAEALALWEFSSANDADFGYSYSKPTVAMMENGKWAVIVGNGYNNSGDGHAKLFIIYIEKSVANNGTWSLDYVKIDTGVGSQTTPNGLSTPRAVDIDGDSVVDRIYAGDLQGNMWAFNVDSSNDSNWDVATKTGKTVTPLFSAKDADGNTQPITTAPIIAKNTNKADATNNAPNLLVFFGTGQYLEENDKTSTDVMTYYGVWDNGSGEKTRSDLTERKLITSTNTRVVSGENIDWTNTEGWYFDFVDRATEDASSVDEIGERVISGSLIRNGILVFTTAIPNSTNTDVCVSNSESWLMAVDLNTGKAPLYSVFDINSDGSMDDSDTTSSYDSNADGTIDADDKVSFGGTKLSGSMAAGDIAILGDNIYSNDVDGNLTKQEVNIEGTEKQGRLSWEELIQQ
jgi:type IV pilus assembly protein PilY1